MDPPSSRILSLRTVSRVAQRSALQTLTKARLVKLAAAFDLGVAQSHPKDDFIEALAGSRKASFEKILEQLTRDELKEICRAHDHDDSGREKRVIIDRILGRTGTRADDAGPGYAPTLDATSGPTTKKRGKTSTKKPKTSSGLDEAAWSSGTKNRLRRFALDAPSRYRAADSDTALATDLIRCFGWGQDDPLPAEIPATRSVVEHGKRRDLKLTAELRERRAVVQVIERDRAMADAWRELLPLILDLEFPPQYVLLCDYREVELYDLARDRMTPRAHIAFEELAKYSDAFPFLSRDWSPGATPRIVDDEKVSKQVADLVAKVYRSFMADYPRRQEDVIHFTLQCIITMFAEDVGLLPRSYFTALLYQGAEHGDVEARLSELFQLMSTPEDTSRTIRYFNGGLFATPVLLSIREPQLRALIRAAEADWRYVDPHIFGSVFQGIMDDDERHATGAHYTAKEDIMRVVGPTIVEPWRKRIDAAETLKELRELRAGLTKFRVLDPACGSGNFLYIAFREMYRLETHILARMHEFTSIADKPKLRSAWGSGIPTTNFYGIDINKFAVELARATLNIAKKIAFDERQEAAFEKFGQVELDLDPSLPLDNLEANIVEKDALFHDWPEVEAIVGNPPILGDRKIRKDLGEAYIGDLKEAFGFDGVVDLSCYWFRRANDHLQPGCRAGLVGTSGLRVGKAREASLDYLVENGSTITNAVSSMPWAGEAALDVCMVNWVKGQPDGPHALHVDGRTYLQAKIATHLQLHVDLAVAERLKANKFGSAMGVIHGSSAFTSSGDSGFTLDSIGASRFIRPIATGNAMLGGQLERSPDYCIDLTECLSEADAARRGGAAFKHLKKFVHPMVSERASSGGSTHHYERWLRTWWHPREPSSRFFEMLNEKSRMIVCSSPQARPIFAFISSLFVPTNTMQVFAFDDDYSYGVIQSGLHWAWLRAKGGRVRGGGDLRYTSEVWKTFPWPQAPLESSVVDVSEAARALRQVRRDLMEANGWSLRALYQAAEVPGPHPLKDAQARLDEAVAAAYDMPPGQEPLEFLLELNLAVAEDEAEGHPVVGPGLPPSQDPNDPRWFSEDCIEPPALDYEEPNA